MENYDFYYDESYQCRKITYKENKSNIETEGGAEFYIGCFLGAKNWKEINQQLSELEKIYKKRNTVEKELKTEHVLKNKYLKNGIASLPEYSVDFYREIFELLNNKVKIHISILSRYEVIIRNLLPEMEWFDRNGCNYKSIVYFMAKFIIYHQEYPFIEIIYSYKNEKWKIKKIIEIFEEHLIKIKGINKKQLEAKVIRDIVYIISKTNFYLRNVNKKILWNYNYITYNFLNYCMTTNITPQHIVVDEEQNIYNAVKSIYQNAEMGDSKEYIELRVCDWLVGIIGKLIISLTKSFRENKKSDYTEQKNLLPNSFFDLTEEKKELVVLMYDVLIEQQDNYWATTTTIYSDEALLFYTYLRYCKWRLDSGKLLDSESFNKFLCVEQNNVFRNMKW